MTRCAVSGKEQMSHELIIMNNSHTNIKVSMQYMGDLDFYRFIIRDMSNEKSNITLQDQNLGS